MIKVRIKIGEEGEILDTYKAWGLIYESSTHILGAAVKSLEATSYPEEEGEHILRKSPASAFDYSVKFLIEGKGELANANARIKAFNDAIAPLNEDGQYHFEQVEFYNDYKKVKIVGIPSPIATATSFWRDKYGELSDAVEVELKIRVEKPSLCDFNYTEA